MPEEEEVTEDFTDVDARLQIKPEFHVEDESSANWVLRKIAEARSGRERVTEQLAAKLKDYQREEKRLLDRFESELERYAAQQLEGKKTKTLKLAEGNLSFRSTSPRLVIEDPLKAEEWAWKNAPEAVKAIITIKDANAITTLTRAAIDAGLGDDPAVNISEPALLVSVLDRKMRATGEIPNGCKIEPGKETFKIG